MVNKSKDLSIENNFFSIGQALLAMREHSLMATLNRGFGSSIKDSRYTGLSKTTFLMGQRRRPP